MEIYDEQGNKTGESIATQVSYYSALQNGSFETPLCNNYSNYQPYITSDTQGIVWKTTASDNKIEIVNASPNKKESRWIWAKTYQALSQKHHQVDAAADGEQFAELNANEVGSLYQDVLTTPGATLNWGLAHRARGDKTAKDTMYVLIMPAELAENINNQADVEKVIQAINNGDETYKGATVQEITDDNQKWYTHTGTYEVPEGQYLTRFFFVSGPTAYDSSSGAKENLKGTIGNHLDNVYFTSELPQPNPDTGHLKIVKTIQGLTQEEATDYSIDVKIEGPNAYTTKTVTLNRFSWNEDKQAYTATHVEQNVPIGSYTVSEVADSAQRDGYTVSVKVNGTDSSEASGTVSIQDRKTSEIWFENTYTLNTYVLSVKKVLTKGNDYADRTKAFDIDITLKDKNGENVSGEFDTEDDKKISFTDGKATVSLKDNEAIKIVGIPAQATYEVQETSDSSKGYDVQYDQKTGTMNRDQSVTVTNTAKDIPTSGVDTGNWVAGGILMAALMAAAGSIYMIMPLLVDIGYLLLKILIIGALAVVMFTFLFGICRNPDASMTPAMKEGDLIIYYRLKKDYQVGDVVVIRQEKETELRRIVARAGDVVDITEEGLSVNGYIQQEDDIYMETLPYSEGITFPVIVGKNQVFLLGDNRSSARDSRIYGPVDIATIKGNVMTIMRRRNL